MGTDCYSDCQCCATPLCTCVPTSQQSRVTAVGSPCHRPRPSSATRPNLRSLATPRSPQPPCLSAFPSVYAIVRHPAYLGFLVWAIGTQVALGNPLCTVAFACVLVRVGRMHLAMHAACRVCVVIVGDRASAWRCMRWRWAGTCMLSGHHHHACCSQSHLIAHPPPFPSDPLVS